MRIDSGPIAARLFDGTGARDIPVQVQFTANGLRLIGEDFERLLSYRLLTNLGVFGEELRIGYQREPDLRLIAPKSIAVMLADWTDAFDAKREGRQLVLLSGALAALAAALGWIVFFGIPMLAEPLARITPAAMEEQFGQNVSAQISLVLRPCNTEQSPAAEALLQRLSAPLAAEMGVEQPLTLTLVRTRIPNAITLPGGRIMVTTGLLDTLQTPNELAAVLAHEIAHVKHRDNLAGAYRRMGPLVLLDAVVGGGGLAAQAILLGGNIVEAGHTRRQEARADETALAALQGADVDPHALARALEALQAFGKGEQAKSTAAQKPERSPNPLSWLDSHPATETRIQAARALPAASSPELLSPAEWDSLRRACPPA